VLRQIQRDHQRRCHQQSGFYVSADQVASYYALMDVVVVPRRPLPVCELVSPMKPLEAMAHGKPVLMSSVAPLAELTSLGPALRCFEKGSVEGLTAALADLLSRKSEHAAWIAATDLSSRHWSRCVAPIVAALANLERVANFLRRSLLVAGHAALICGVHAVSPSPAEAGLLFRI